MIYEELYINDLYLIKPKIYKDNRGFFFESFKNSDFKKNIYDASFIQENQSYSKKGTLRGLHFQKYPFEQSKLVSCIYGEILDVAVDLRKDSNTFKSHYSVKLNSINNHKLFIPKGFAHGFIVLSDFAIVSYKIDNKYMKSHESGIIYNDKELNIDWILNESEIITSEKDKKLNNLKNEI
tara:strand:+ start:1734 stop:2273 length:540 start_codon:yes stop_codon:yes gene_type:complete